MTTPSMVTGSGPGPRPLEAPPSTSQPPDVDAAENAAALASLVGLPPPSEGGLGAQSIIEETAVQIRSTDSRIREIHTAIQRDLDAMDALSRQQTALQAIREALQSKTTDANKAIELSSLTVHVGTETRPASELAAELDLNLDASVSQNMLASRIDGLDSTRKRLEGRQETRHLALQDLLHRRSQALELASNLIRSINDTQKALVGNVGR